MELKSSLLALHRLSVTEQPASPASLCPWPGAKDSGNPAPSRDGCLLCGEGRSGPLAQPIQPCSTWFLEVIPPWVGNHDGVGRDNLGPGCKGGAPKELHSEVSEWSLLGVGMGSLKQMGVRSSKGPTSEEDPRILPPGQALLVLLSADHYA